MRKMMTIIAALCFFASLNTWAMVEMPDDQLGNVTGQALLQMNKIEGIGNQATGTDGITFYTAGLDAMLDLNLNIEKLQLGCGGANTGLGCDLDIDNFSLGCIAASSGGCITLNPAAGTNQKPGAIRDCGSANCTTNTVDTSIHNAMRDFTIKRPFFQFAVKNDGSKTLREIVGIRMGGEQVSGPMSFGSLNVFSGYMSGEADIFMRGETDVSPTCTAPDVCPGTGGRSKYSNASAYLGLDNSTILNIGIVAIRYRDLTMDYTGQSRENIIAEVSGNRIDNIGIEGLRLADLVDDIIDTVQVNRICADGLFGCSILAGQDIANLLLPALAGGISGYIQQEMATGLGISVADLNTYVLPFNLQNIHQLEVDTPLFGLSFQKQDVQYPGYKAAVETGWAMYAPDAFNLVIDDKVSSFMKGIVSSTNARDGNIVGLEAPYRNCWGTSRFC